MAQAPAKTAELDLVIGGKTITKAEIDGWKKKYGGVHLFEVTDYERNQHRAIFKFPSRGERAAMMALLAEKDFGDAFEGLLNDCFLAKDAAFEDTSDTNYLYNELVAQAYQVLPKLKVTVKNL